MAKKNKQNGDSINWVSIISVVILLSIFSYFARVYIEPIKTFVENNQSWGIFTYLTVGIVDAVIGPGLSLPLIPIAGRIWGSFAAGLLTIAGWVSGSLIAFLLVRVYGKPLVKHFVSINKVNKIRTHIPKNLFWGIVLVRLAFPMDVFSYALGLFTEISVAKYFWATLIGVAPSAFILAYIGKLPLSFEITTYIIGGCIFIWLAYFVRKVTR